MYIKREYLADTHKHSCRLVMTICTPFGKHLPAFLGYLASMRCDSDLVMRLKFALCGRISINLADSRRVTQKSENCKEHMWRGAFRFCFDYQFDIASSRCFFRRLRCCYLWMKVPFVYFCAFECAHKALSFSKRE